MQAATKNVRKSYPPIKIGDRYDRQVVLAEAPPRQPGNRPFWLVRCDCGYTRPIAAGTLKNGTSTACRTCSDQTRPPRTPAAIEATAASVRKHGKSTTPTYDAWINMRRRCIDPSCKAFKGWGGRGVQVYQEWLESFEAFLRDMGECPDGTSLDRINNNGHYEPGNCAWRTAIQQVRNRRNTVLVDTPGGYRPLVDFLDQAAASMSTVRVRLQKGWSLEDALTTPSGPSGRRRSRFMVETPAGPVALADLVNGRVAYARVRKRLKCGWSLERALAGP